jgi:hypothetical protein
LSHDWRATARIWSGDFKPGAAAAEVVEADRVFGPVAGCEVSACARDAARLQVHFFARPRAGHKESVMVADMVMLAQSNSSGGGMIAMLMLLIQVAFVVGAIAGLWKVFAKAGQPGWAAIVPLYNIYIWTKIVGRPWWFLLLFLIPFINLLAAIVMCWDLARSFGKSALFTVGLVLLSPVFLIMLGFGKDQYKGPAAAGEGMAPKLA